MKLGGYFDESGDRVGFHLLHDLSPMRFNSNLADAKFAADLFVQQAGDDQHHDLPFTGSEGSKTRYSSSSLLKKAQTCRVSSSWEPAKGMGAVVFCIANLPRDVERRPSSIRMHQSERNCPTDTLVLV